MKELKTIEVELLYGKGGKAIINESDFDKKKHKIFSEKKEANKTANKSK